MINLHSRREKRKTQGELRKKEKYLDLSVQICSVQVITDGQPQMSCPLLFRSLNLTLINEVKGVNKEMDKKSFLRYEYSLCMS